MRIYLGSDHAGLETKNAVIQHLRAAGHETIDCGAHVYDALDDYPAFCIETARRVVADEGSLGIVLGGSGNGEQIAANKVQGCAMCLGVERRDCATGPRAQQRSADRARRSHALPRGVPRDRGRVPRRGVVGRGAPPAPHRHHVRLRGERYRAGARQGLIVFARRHTLHWSGWTMSTAVRRADPGANNWGPTSLG